jgi:RNA polymerase sigma-70 factor (ECF subfamily)
MDIAQNTFISVHQKISRLRDVASFKTWLYRIAINCSHEEMRKLNRLSEISLNSSERQIVIVEDRSIEVEDDIRYQPDARLQRQELADIIMASLQTLSEEQRVVVIMKEYEGLKFREIAESLDISESTAKSRLYYGLKHLRSKLSNVIYGSKMEVL